MINLQRGERYLLYNNSTQLDQVFRNFNLMHLLFLCKSLGGARVAMSKEAQSFGPADLKQVPQNNLQLIQFNFVSKKKVVATEFIAQLMHQIIPFPISITSLFDNFSFLLYFLCHSNYNSPYGLLSPCVLSDSFCFFGPFQSNKSK